MKTCRAKTELTCLHSLLSTLYHGFDLSINCIYSLPIKPYGLLGFPLILHRLSSCKDSLVKTGWTCRVLFNGRPPASSCDSLDYLRVEVETGFRAYDHQRLRPVLVLGALRLFVSNALRSGVLSLLKQILAAAGRRPDY